MQPQQPYSNTPPHRPAYAAPYGGNGNSGNVGTPPQYMGGAGSGSTATPPLGGGGAGLGGAAAAVGVGASAGGPPSNLPDSQRQLLMQVLNLTDAQIADLPADQRDSIMMLRKQYGK